MFRYSLPVSLPQIARRAEGLQIGFFGQAALGEWLDVVGTGFEPVWRLKLER